MVLSECALTTWEKRHWIPALAINSHQKVVNSLLRHVIVAHKLSGDVSLKCTKNRLALLSVSRMHQYSMFDVACKHHSQLFKPIKDAYKVTHT